MNELLNRLKRLQASYALESLKTPGEKNAYEFGLRVGVVLGVEKAINELLNLVEEQDKRDL